jgi:hypothetical protein
MIIWVRVSDLTGVGAILHPWVAPTSDPHRDRFERGFSFTPAGDWVPKKVQQYFSPITPAAQPS